MVDREHLSLSIARQCALLGVARSSLYYRPREASGENLTLMQAMDRRYLDTPARQSTGTIPRTVSVKSVTRCSSKPSWLNPWTMALQYFCTSRK